MILMAMPIDDADAEADGDDDDDDDYVEDDARTLHSI